MRWAF